MKEFLNSIQLLEGLPVPLSTFMQLTVHPIANSCTFSYLMKQAASSQPNYPTTEGVLMSAALGILVLQGGSGERVSVGRFRSEVDFRLQVSAGLLAA